MAADTMVGWVLPENLPLTIVWFVLGVFGLATLVICATVLLRRQEPGAGRWPNGLAMVATLSLVLLLYPPFLIFASTFVDANVNFNPRLMALCFHARSYCWWSAVACCGKGPPKSCAPLRWFCSQG